jgi:hypothetical protein
VKGRLLCLLRHHAWEPHPAFEGLKARRCNRCGRVEADVFHSGWRHRPHLDGLSVEQVKALGWRKRMAREAACRTRDWKRRKGIVGIRYIKASQNGKSSGLQVSYLKLVSDIPDEPMSKEEVEQWVTSKLSTRQREQLNQRSG